jgi:spindle assembly abnormal protein 6
MTPPSSNFLLVVSRTCDPNEMNWFDQTAKCHRRQKAHSSKAEETTQAKLDELAANLKLASVKELETTKKKMESEHHAAQVGLRSTIETITVQNAELDKQVCVLIDTKYKLDSRLSDVSSRASNAERELQLAREEVARLQNISAELNKVSG